MHITALVSAIFSPPFRGQPKYLKVLKKEEKIKIYKKFSLVLV